MMMMVVMVMVDTGTGTLVPTRYGYRRVRHHYVYALEVVNDGLDDDAAADDQDSHGHVVYDPDPDVDTVKNRDIN